jgi:HEAT repeat protein
MELNEFVEIVEDMALQHAYPGYDVRSLRLGLPAAVMKSPNRLFVEALKSESVLTKLAALRWFWERPGDAKRYVKQIAEVIDDPDEWVRLEAARTVGRIENPEEAVVLKVAGLLSDENVEVRKAAAKTCGKVHIKSEAIVEALKKATTDSDTEVRWKAQKALRKLGVYAT